MFKHQWLVQEAWIYYYYIHPFNKPYVTITHHYFVHWPILFHLECEPILLSYQPANILFRFFFFLLHLAWSSSASTAAVVQAYMNHLTNPISSDHFNLCSLSLGQPIPFEPSMHDSDLFNLIQSPDWGINNNHIQPFFVILFWCSAASSFGSFSSKWFVVWIIEQCIKLHFAIRTKEVWLRQVENVVTE